MNARFGLKAAVGYLLMALLSAGLALGQSTAPSPTTTGSDVGPLKIHVTAVQGGAQYRNSSYEKWKAVAASLDLTEGVEFRTGPRGAVQFTVGDDQVFRVDRLSVVKVLRANLGADGTIKTDVGMTYGRVSKDVDLPTHPHADTISSPSSTLAVRGTHVSLYDQPPFEPEAVSLTGKAYFKNGRGLFVSLGSKGGGTVSVGGNYASPADYQFVSTAVGLPNYTSTGTQNFLSSLGGLSSAFPSAFPVNSFISGKLSSEAAIGSTGVPGLLTFDIIWASTTTPQTIVDFKVTGPDGDFVTSASGGPTSSSTGGQYDGPSHTANAASTTTPFGTGFEGFQTITWGQSGKPFPNGTYTITETLAGAASSASPPFQVSTETEVTETVTGGGSGTATAPNDATLTTGSNTESVNVQVPIMTGQGLTGGVARPRSRH